MTAMSEHAGRTTWKTIVLAVLLAVLVALALGTALGAAAVAVTDADYRARSLLIAAIGLVIGGGAIWGLVRLKPWAGPDEPMAPSTRKARNWLWASAAVGALMGGAITLATLDSDNPFILYSNEPLPPALVIGLIAVIVLIVPLISWQWHRSVDEHEIEAYRFGGVLALYPYVFLTPAWWLAWRGGLAPEPNAMLIYVGVLAIWTAGWFWRRYR